MSTFPRSESGIRPTEESCTIISLFQAYHSNIIPTTTVSFTTTIQMWPTISKGPDISTCEAPIQCFSGPSILCPSKPSARRKDVSSRSLSEPPPLSRKELFSKTDSEELRFENTQNSAPGKFGSNMESPSKTISETNNENSAPETFVSSVASFSSHRDLQDLPTILDEAYAREANLKEGAIKISLAGDPRPLSRMSLKCDTFTFSLCYKGGLIYAPRSIKEKQVEVNFESKEPYKFCKADPEELALEFEMVIKEQKLTIVDYMPDIPVDDSRFRKNLGLSPSLLTALPNNILSTLSKKFIGINTTTAFLSPTYGSPFSTHLEDLKFGSANHLLYGMPKLWIIVPPSEKENFEKMVRNKTKTRRRCSQFVRHLGNYIPLAMLKASGIKYHLILQHPGEVIFTFPNTYHQGFNLGPNIAEAINYASALDFKNYTECTKSCMEGFPPIKKSHILSSQPKKRSLENGVDPPPKKAKLRNTAATDFGNPSAMIPIIYQSIAAKRRAFSQTEQFSDEDVRVLWERANIGGDRHSLVLRYAHERFSRCWGSLAKSQSRRTVVNFMKQKLGISDQRTYESVRNAAARDSIWVRLCDIFEEDLKDNKCVAICGFTGQRSLEDLTVREKDKFLQGVQEKKAELLPLFQAVLPAFLFIVGRQSSLPTLRIERHPFPGENSAKELSHMSMAKFQEYLRTDDRISRVRRSVSYKY